jgi:hypothetical protein
MRSHRAQLDAMARTTTIIEGPPPTDEPPAQPVLGVERVERISWGAILGGAVTALAVGALLYALGLALGLSALDPNDPESFRASSIFTGIWSLVTAFIALFVGGLVASREAGWITRTGGAIHGLVMWGLTTVGGALVLFSLLTQAISGAAALGKTAIKAGANAAGQAQQQGALGIDFNDMLAPINSRLQQEGKPPVTSEQVNAATKDVLQDAARQGRLDRNLLVNSIAQNTNLSRTDAQDIASRIQTSFDDAASKVAGAAQSTGKAFWGVFAAMLIGMISAVLGAMLGASSKQRRGPGRGTPAEAGYGDAYYPAGQRTY